MKRWTVSLPNPDGYDIKPFDTTFHTPQEIVLAADHDAEIERLRRQVEEAAIHIPAHVAIEIERLHKTLDDHLNSEAAETRRADKERDRARKADAEIVRLRADNDVLDAEAGRCQ